MLRIRDYRCLALNMISLSTGPFPPRLREHCRRRKERRGGGSAVNAVFWTGYGQCMHELTVATAACTRSTQGKLVEFQDVSARGSRVHS